MTTNNEQERSPCSGCFYKDMSKKHGHCGQCSDPAEFADSIHIEGAITAIDYKNPLIIIGKDAFSGALLFPQTLGGGGQ